MTPGHIDSLYVSATKRAIRAFVIGFLAVYPAPAVLGSLSGSQPLDTTALRAAAVAGLMAAGAFIWRAFIDPLPVPTLSDANRKPPTA